MDARRSAPATARNREPILAVLRRVLPGHAGTRVLEIASGTGEHAVAFGRGLPHVTWQPTDPDPANVASIDAWRAAEHVANVAPAIRAAASDLPASFAADAMVCINMIHIAPWSACEALMRGAAALLAAGAPLVLYGPYKRGGVHTAESNAQFDADLRAQNPAWGVRDLEAVQAEAAAAGFRLDEVVPMPANNLTVVFCRR